MLKITKKWILTMIISTIALVILIACFLPTINEARLKKIDQEYLSTVVSAIEDTQHAQPLPLEYQEKAKTLNRHIINYFNNVHHLDISERIYHLEVKHVDFFDTSIAGFYNDSDVDRNIIYISSSLLQEDASHYFESTYVHEVLHYLGSSDKNDNAHIFIYEGITEIIRENIFEYSNLFYLDAPWYKNEIAEAKKLFEIYPDLERIVIETNGMFNLNTITDADKIERKLKLKSY